MKKVSICIPCYEMKSKGIEFLNDLLYSINFQTCLPYEVCISDHSMNDDLLFLCDKYKDLNIIYAKNNHNRGSNSSNINNAISMSSGDVIDIMFQDDFYYNQDSLHTRVESLIHYWSLTSTIHMNDNKEFFWRLDPLWRDDIYLGRNSIGSPSLCTLNRDCFLEFDENLKMLMDCDFYMNMKLNYGYPDITHIITVVSRKWEGQMQNHIDQQQINKEIIITKQKYENRNRDNIQGQK